MSPVRLLRDELWLLKFLVFWTLLAVPVGAIIGTCVAFFLWLLSIATAVRGTHPYLLYFLPLGGLVIALMYGLFGKSVEAGNNLIIDEIHEPGGGVPFRMLPLVLIGTVLTHLFGGSAGREGTAVQMGGSIASAVSRWCRLSPRSTSTLLTCGIAAGFGAVFGTPVAGAIFAIEVLAIGRLNYTALVPCLVAAIVGDLSCTSWNFSWHNIAFHIIHAQYRIGMIDVRAWPDQAWLLGKVALAAIAFGLVSILFGEAIHLSQAAFKRTIRWPMLRPVVGGALIILLVLLIRSDAYIGLGLPQIADSFHPGGAHAFSWGWKILFTAVTLGSGFKGGEVTPLFFVGATLGNVLARLMNAPTDLFAALGFVAVFAGATNTPLACTVMFIELFGGSSIGSPLIIYAAVACGVAYLFSGHRGIYASQRVDTAKPMRHVAAGASSR